MTLNRMRLMPLGGQFGAVLDFQRLENSLKVFFHGQNGNLQFIGDLLVILA